MNTGLWNMDSGLRLSAAPEWRMGTCRHGL